MIWNSLLLVFPLLYGIQLLRWRHGLKSLKKPIQQMDISISLIIPFRNEAKNLEKLIQSIKKQNFTDFEVLLVDDFSTDNATKIALKSIANDPRFRIIANLHPGKKGALTTGISHAKNEYIVATDADVAIQDSFIAQMAAGLSVQSTVWVSGQVQYYSNGSFWTEFLAAEQEGLQAITAGSMGINQPTMANGAAMGFTKSAFNAVAGYKGLEHIASGDDELLLHRLASKGTVSYIKSAVILTNPPESWTAFWLQRRRWVSKAGNYENNRMKRTMQYSWLAHVSKLIYLMLFWKFNIAVGICIFIVNFCPEQLLLAYWGTSLKRRMIHALMWIPYSIYVLIIPFLALGKKVSWKGRPT
jgi:cellulose synthase/poly-beta-1,6-N-acetylglucosamine synthase-like glycosyltransferase